MTKTVLIAGASGNFGKAAAAAFTAAGWKVHPYQRGTDMAAAAQGAAVIVNALNPPNYHDWARNIPAITAQVIAAAKASGALVIVPGNVYIYGVQAGPWGPNTPHLPNSRKGTIRAQMEAQYRKAAQDGVRTLILRGGDYIEDKTGPQGARTIFGMITKGIANGKLVRFGAADAMHAYAPLADMARAAVALADHPDLPDYADVPFAGLSFSINELRAEAERQLGRSVSVSAFAWWSLRLVAPFWELARELLEMRYLNSVPHQLDPAPMAALLPDFRTQTLAGVVAKLLKAD